jgi:hypothetical protein
MFARIMSENHKGSELYPHGTVYANGMPEERISARKWVTAVIQRQISIEHAAPWLVSSISGFYIMARARRLSLAEASNAPLTKFLLRQSDVMLMLCGCPALWHFARNRRASRTILYGTQARAVHHLRQVFTALMIGTGLLARKATAGKTAQLAALATRLNKIARDGAATLDELGDPHPLDLLVQHELPANEGANGNGASAV